MKQKQNFSRKVISIVLSLLMVFSCFSGMGLTAFAAPTCPNPGCRSTNVEPFDDTWECQDCGYIFNWVSGDDEPADSAEDGPLVGTVIKVGDTLTLDGDYIEYMPGSSNQVTNSYKLERMEYDDYSNGWGAIFEATGAFLIAGDETPEPDGFYVSGGNGTQSHPYTFALHYASAEPETPTVAVSPANSGTVEAVEDGDNWKFTATPASGYEFDCWKANDDGDFDTVSDNNPFILDKSSFTTMSNFTAVFKEAAQTETLLTTITATGKEQANYSTANVATVSFSYTAGGSSAYLANWGWWGYGWIATVTPADGYTITKCVFYDDANRIATDSSSPFVVETTEEDKTPRINGTPIDGGNYQSKGIKKIEVYGYQTPSSSYAGYLPAEADDADALAAKVVKFNGHDWYLIEDNSTSATEGTVTLLAADTSFGATQFNSNDLVNKYSTSTIKTYLDGMTETGGAFANVADAIETVTVTTENDTDVTAKLYLLSKTEAGALPANVLMLGNFTGAEYSGAVYWLRSPNPNSGMEAAYVSTSDGTIHNGLQVYYTFGVRPALQLDLSKVGFNSETNTFAVPHIHDDITFTAWTSTNSLPTDGGNYYLTNDVVLENVWYAPNGAINLCLDGHSITAAEGKEIQLMDVENGATLNLYDKEDNSGSISGAKSRNGAILVKSGTFNMYGGTVKDNMTTDHGAGVRVHSGGTFSLYGGSIENNKTQSTTGGCGGGVHVETNSTFNMSGGSIKNNTAAGGAGVFIGSNCTFNLSGGSITGNIATAGEGGVSFTSDSNSPATFKLSGNPTVTDNISKFDDDAADFHISSPSNVALGEEMKIEVVGALTGDGKIGISRRLAGVFTNSSNSVKASDYIDKFTTDSRMYRIKTEGDELRIESPHLVIGGTFVYDDNAADVFGDGKVKFTPASGENSNATLTLNGYQYDGTEVSEREGIVYFDTNPLDIVLKGENKIKVDNAPGIMIDALVNTVISSDNGGSLEVVSEQGDAIYTNGALTVESGTISATGANRGIAANGINLSGGKIVATGTGERGYGIYCENLPWLSASSVNINSGITSLIASGTLGAVYGGVANALEGLGWSNITGTEGQKTIAVAAEARSLEYKKVAFVSHTHSFTYFASGATITATCSADGCTLTDSKATLTIAAPDNLTYDKSAKAAVITDANAIRGTAKVQYQTKNGSTYGEATETAPTNAGTYKASITVGGATASVEYTIAKADPTYTAPTGLTATYGQTLADVTLPTGWTWADNTASVGSAGTNTFKANFTPADTANYNVVENVDVTVKVSKANQTAPTAPTAAGKTINSITLNEIPNGEYKCGSGDWQTSPTFTGLDQNKGYTFRQRYAADANHNASAGSEETIIYTANHTHNFTYSASNGTITATCNGAGTCSLTDNKVSFTLTAPTNLVYDGTDKKATLEGVDAFNAATGLNVSANDIVYNDLTNVVTETKNAGTYQALYTLRTDFPRPFVGITFTVAKANPTCTAPTGLTATYGQTLADVTLTNPSGNTAGTWAWVDDTTSVGNIGTKTFKANFTPADTTNYNTVENVDVTVKVNPADITPTVTLEGWTYGQVAKTPSVSGNSGNGDVAYTYAKKGSDNFSATVPTNAGNYTVKATIAATTNYNGATATADFTIAKADPTYTVPTGLYATYGDTLADVTLPERWAWADNTASVGNAGTNTFKANFTPADTTNYNTVNDVDVTINVSKADPTYTVPTGVTATYGDTLADVMLPEGWAWVDGTTSVGDAGKRTFKANFTPADTTNYNVVENVDVTVKVNQAEITPTVTLDGWTYGETANKPIVTGNTGNGDVTYLYKEKGASDMSCTDVVPTQAGEYTVKALIAETANYNGGEATADFTIAKAKVTVTAEDKTSKREAALKELTYKVDGKILDGDDLGIKVSSNAKAAVAGKYDIKVAYTENANYDVKVVDGTYTVTDRITATEKTAGKNKINSAAKASASKKGVTVKWGKVANADKFEIYATYCGKKNKYKKIKTVKGNINSFDITKLGGKKVDTSKCLKVYVVAYRKVNGKYEKITQSINMHIAGAKNKHTNAKAIKVKKSSYTLKVNKTATIKPTLVLENKNKKAVDHVAKFRYQSTNKAVATVDKNGKIKAVGKGTCTIYIFANNGKLKSVKVTVK
ncbi:MAG: Ig-like domain-containing protein [Eubacterium sp.]|nr:Ig-like domain-containing protein [Eubacterium sp.]